ncbi:hypothetical protein SS1G_03594 [Sclerotinia sclerotiorum 1980 UF-70]|uniref:Uncharacterized protein n=1 Tax=Sclerotinia sclerotiorum (strain ATCC 18683 / 1980 / Ss-1) TaxID=665079 RepID=A7EE54_SCLS1|nr:hypothetical protein SS1G_03594 [Sclerotinia sclerotiorum 1980 UF-70]EDO01120.1 hypothetical protein SS1G_03594 [Sclerotinia sclerotiorum 1980 UF-70]
MAIQILLINPNEVHIDDPDFFEEMFSQSNGRAQKPLNVAEAFGTQDHDHHRIRRAALNPFFSKKSINDLVARIQRPILILCDRLEKATKTGEILNMKYFYAAVTLDIINDYCFSREPDNVLRPDFGRKSFDDVDTFLNISLLDNINKILAPAMADILDFRKVNNEALFKSVLFNIVQDLSRQVETIRDEHRKYQIEKVVDRTVFHELLESKLPPKELERDRLRDEAFSLVTAGSGTTAYVLRGTSYHISANPRISELLHEELKSAIPDPLKPLSLPELEKLPYLTAVIQEGLRLADPVTHRIGRQYPEKSFQCNGKTIPAGTIMNMTALLTHQNEKIFPEPEVFKPERWLETENKRLEHYLVTFNRGTRSCLGINLARAELYLILASVYRQFDFDVSQVIRARDIDVSRDYILGAQARDTPGILVKVRKVD